MKSYVEVQHTPDRVHVRFYFKRGLEKPLRSGLLTLYPETWEALKAFLESTTSYDEEITRTDED